MTDIFLSYAHEDETRIRDLVRALEEHGWSIFWDRRIPTGKTWQSYIGQALSDAKCVMVAWSHHSVTSEWVIEEANNAKKRGLLMPILLDPVDPPLGFGGIQAANMTDWKRGLSSPHFDNLIEDIAEIVADKPHRPTPEEKKATPQPQPVETPKAVTTEPPPQEPTPSTPAPPPSLQFETKTTAAPLRPRRRVIGLGVGIATFVALLIAGWFSFGPRIQQLWKGPLKPSPASQAYQEKRTDKMLVDTQLPASATPEAPEEQQPAAEATPEPKKIAKPKKEAQPKKLAAPKSFTTGQLEANKPSTAGSADGRSKHVGPVKREKIISGSTVLLGTWYWDVESNTQGESRTADFWWNQASDSRRTLRPLNGTKLKMITNRNYDQIDEAFIRAQELYETSLDGSDTTGVLAPGSIIVFKTSEGNFGKMQVVRYRALHDFSFPEAVNLTEPFRKTALAKPDREKYHLQVKWQLFR